MPSSGTEKTFAWIGSAIVNVAFISFITWGATSNWWIGFIVSVFYTILLFGLARVLDSEHSWLVFFSRFRSPHDVEDIDRFNESQSRRPSMLVTLLYGLATLSLGVTGSFLSMNAIDCSTDPYDEDRRERPDYKTDMSKLPADVQKWERNTGPKPRSSFVYLPGSKRTLFNEYVDDEIGKLWSVIPVEDGPKVLNEFAAYEFVLPKPSLACFITGQRRNQERYYSDNRKIVACSDGSKMQFAKGTNSIPPYARRNLFVSQSNILWYQDDPPSDHDRFKTSNRLIYSLDPETMVETLHSVHVEPSDNDNEHLPYEECRKTKALASLLLVALPTIISSSYLWYQRQVPSMGISTFIGLTTAALCIYYYSTNVRDDPFDYFVQRWLLWFGLVYLLACGNGILSSYFEDKAPMRWGLHMAAVSFFVGSSLVLELYDYSRSLIHWTIFNVAALVPLCGLGLATRSPFLLVLTAIGIVMDAFHLCEEITKNMGETPAALVYFAVLGLTGLGTAMSGWFLSHRQDDLSNFVAAYLEPYAWPRRQPDFAVIPTQDDLYLEAPPIESGNEQEAMNSYNLEARSSMEEAD